MTTDSTSQAYKKARKLHLKTTRNRDKGAESQWTPFRAAEKRYKARFPPPDLSNVLDLATLDPQHFDEVHQAGWFGRSDAVECREIPSSCSKAYIVPRIPGLVLLPGFLSPGSQKDLIRWAVCDQARYPNETNLDIHYILPEDGLWNTWLRTREDATNDILVQPRASISDITDQPPPGPRQLINNTPATPENYSTLSSDIKPPLPPSLTVQPSLSSALLRKLRWANIGWYYHWGTKQYDFSKGKGTIDPRVRDVCKCAVEAVNWAHVFGIPDSGWIDEDNDWATWNETYEPDAGIVNFYQNKDTLMGHVDRSEVCATEPLVSISLGNAAIFLIGGLTRDVEPVPILLRSGDVVVMSGPACRRAYHGVPRVLENTLPHYLQDAADDEWKPYDEYLRTTRINVNVRQVFPKGFDPGDVGA